MSNFAKPSIEIRDARFVFGTNFAGDPSRDRFKSRERKCCLVLKDPAVIAELESEGFNVRETNPTSDRYQPEKYVTVKMKFAADGARRDPIIKLVTNNIPMALDANSVHMLDTLADNRQISDVKCMCSKFQSDGYSPSLYVQCLYATRAADYDPYASEYEEHGDAYDADFGMEEAPF